MDELEKFEHARDLLRARMNKYTERAFRIIPYMDTPGILDIGCGSGIPTLALAGLCNGRITAMDTDQDALDRLAEKVSDAGLSDRITAIHHSILEMDFPEASFDILWAEGSVFIAGFEQSLKNWRRLLRSGGFMALHDDLGDINEKLMIIPLAGYRLLDYFILDTETWYEDYYDPLQELINKTMHESIHDDKLRKVLDNQQSEVTMVKQNPVRCASVFFVLQKSDI
jgi:ubiquinone/menaquinone biosynthesis C-methylase UbiE